MNKILTNLFIFLLTAVGLFLFARAVISQSAAGIQYPINELGGCKDKADCKVYCDGPENTSACLDFAQKNKLMSSQEVEAAKKFVAGGSKGPGGCVGQAACENYCDEISHIDECVAFAEKNNLMSPEELNQAKKVQAAIAKGVKPPPCGNKAACDVYCEDSSHMEECISFAAEAGFMQDKELEDAQKMLAAIKKGAKPPPCKGKGACDEYCSQPDNMEVCMNFAIEAGFMSEQEKADAQKMLQAIKKGAKPPACKGKEDCDVYCGQDEHFEECMNFAEAAGFMTAEEAAMARKTGGKGPGGCKNKDECDAFCKNPDNQETCFNFAKDNGMISEEDLKRMEEGQKQMQESLQQAPPEVIECLNSKLGGDEMAKIKNGTAVPSQKVGDTMGDCFKEFMPRPEEGSPPPGQNGEMMPPQGSQGGPGGCQTPEECLVYCQANPKECGSSQAPPPGDHQEERSAPTGNFAPPDCTSPENCQNFQPNNQPPSQYQPLPDQRQGAPCEGTACQTGPWPEQSPQPPEEYNATPSDQYQSSPPLDSQQQFNTAPPPAGETPSAIQQSSEPQSAPLSEQPTSLLKNLPKSLSQLAPFLLGSIAPFIVNLLSF